MRPRPPVATLSYSSLQEYRRCGYRFYAERVLGLPALDATAAGGSATEVGPVPARDRAAASRRSADADPRLGVRSAADRGVLVHALLERLHFRRPLAPTTASVAAAAARTGIEPEPGPGESDELIALVRRFAESELCARLGRATSVRREQRFSFALPRPHAGGRARRSSPARSTCSPVSRAAARWSSTTRPIDCRAPTRGPAAAGYEIQRLIYAIAALRAGADEVEIAHCFLEAPDAPVIVSFGADRLPELDASLRVARGSASSPAGSRSRPSRAGRCAAAVRPRAGCARGRWR